MYNNIANNNRFGFIDYFIRRYPDNTLITQLILFESIIKQTYDYMIHVITINRCRQLCIIVSFHDWRKIQDEGFRTRDSHIMEHLTKNKKDLKFHVLQVQGSWEFDGILQRYQLPSSLSTK